MWEQMWTDAHSTEHITPSLRARWSAVHLKDDLHFQMSAAVI